MLKTSNIISLLFAIISVTLCENVRIVQFSNFPHNKNCYSQGLFFLNQTYVFESCGLYNKSYFHILEYEQTSNGFGLNQTYKSLTPLDGKVFLEGCTLYPKTNKIYLLTWREHLVYAIDPINFQTQYTLKWQKDGWGLTNNDTHMFVTDGSPNIYVVDEKFKILEQKIIYDQNNRKVFSLNQLQLVKEQNGKEYIYANVYMERRIVKIDFEKGKVVKQFDMLKVIQNQKGLRYDQVINGIAYNPKSQKFLITGKNWGNFYEVDFN